MVVGDNLITPRFSGCCSQPDKPIKLYREGIGYSPQDKSLYPCGIIEAQTMLKGLVEDILANNKANADPCWRLQAYAADAPYPGRIII